MKRGGVFQRFRERLQRNYSNLRLKLLHCLSPKKILASFRDPISSRKHTIHQHTPFANVSNRVPNDTVGICWKVKGQKKLGNYGCHWWRPTGFRSDVSLRITSITSLFLIILSSFRILTPRPLIIGISEPLHVPMQPKVPGGISVYQSIHPNDEDSPWG